jgi:hypothetical protein
MKVIIFILKRVIILIIIIVVIIIIKIKKKVGVIVPNSIFPWFSMGLLLQGMHVRITAVEITRPAIIDIIQYFKNSFNE